MLEEKQNIELPGEAKEAELCERKAKVPSLSDKVHQKSGVLCGMAAAFSVITLVCLYGNPDGIAGTFWAVCIFVLFFAVFGLLGLSVKKESYFLASGTILLALSNACTLNSFFHFFNWIGIFILLTLFFLNQFYETEAWGIWETAKNGFLLWLHSFACIGEPFYNLRKRAPEHENSRKYGTMLVLTICFCLPVLIVMALILSSADQVFARLIKRLFFFPFWNGELWGYAVWLVLGFFGFYCLISAGGKSRGSGKGKRKDWDSFPAVVACSLFAVLYGIFCGIQLIYLFGGGLFSLPEGLTYASYARTGFFQLLFVAFLNFCCFLLVLSKFKENRLLRTLLTLLTVCTFIMIGSAAYRMVLYIGQYDLSFLRVLVLWFLAVLTVLLSGFLVYLYRRTFSLFRFLLTTVLFSWLLLVFIRPDFWIARYNMEQGKQEEIDFEYVYTLSRDAAPALSGLSEGSQAQLFWFWKDLEENYKNRSIREWNLSSWLAKESAESWMEKQYGGSPESLIH